MNQPLVLLLPVFLLFLLLLLGVTVREGRSQVLSYEPISVVKSLLATQSSREQAVWKQLKDGDRQMRNSLRSTLKPSIQKGQAVVLSVRGELILQEFRGQVKLTSPLAMPSLNILSLLATSIPILFEGFKSKTLTDKLGSIVKSGDKSLVSGYESMAMLDLLNKIPKDDDPKKFLEQFRKQADVAFRVANALLGSEAREAWIDSFMGVEMDDAEFDGNTITTTLSLLLRFANVVCSELSTLKTLQKTPYPHSERFAFGWWLNCVAGGKSCLLRSAPSDAVFSISPQLRIYLVPSLETMLLIVSDTGASAKSFKAIIESDDNLWRQIKATFSPGESEEEESVVSKEELKEAKKEEKHERKERDVTGDKAAKMGKGREGKMEEEAEEREMLWEEQYLPEFLLFFTSYIRMYFQLTASLHWFNRGMLFAVFIVVTHYLCYAGFHCMWLFGTFFSKNVHKPRPVQEDSKID